MQIEEQLLSLTRSTKNLVLQFLEDLSIAEYLQPKGEVIRTAQALKDAESLLSPDLTIPKLEPRFVLELYGRECDLADKQSKPASSHHRIGESHASCRYCRRCKGYGTH